jgi:hypothetical protein
MPGPRPDSDRRAWNRITRHSPAAVIRADAIARFFDQVSPEPNSGCWLWLGAETANGYGQFTVMNRATAAHRFSYEHHNGPIPPGMLVCHRCDVRCCVNPEHLFLGTFLDNNRDCAAKGRSSGFTLHGEAAPSRVLSAAQVLEIVKRRRAGEKGRVLAHAYGVNANTITAIMKGRAWVRVTGIRNA